MIQGKKICLAIGLCFISNLFIACDSDESNGQSETNIVVSDIKKDTVSDKETSSSNENDPTSSSPNNKSNIEVSNIKDNTNGNSNNNKVKIEVSDIVKNDNKKKDFNEKEDKDKNKQPTGTITINKKDLLDNSNQNESNNNSNKENVNDNSNINITVSDINGKSNNEKDNNSNGGYLNNIVISKGDIVNTPTTLPIVNVNFLDLPHNYSVNAIESTEKRIFELVNQFRVENGLPTLIYSKNLESTARYKSNSMVQFNYFSHYLPNHENKLLGYLIWDVYHLNCNVAGENIFKYEGPTSSKVTAEYMVESWKNSPTHRAAMLSTKYKYIGVGVVYKMDNSVIYATQHFSD